MKNSTTPSLTALFIAACRYTAKLDAAKTEKSVEELKKENDSFYDRTVATFVKIASHYYDTDVVLKWVEKKLLELKDLPKLN